METANEGDFLDALSWNSVSFRFEFKNNVLNSLPPGIFFPLFSMSVVFFRIKTFFKKIFFWDLIRVSNCLDPDQARHYVGPDLGPNCLQWLSADHLWR